MAHTRGEHRRCRVDAQARVAAAGERPATGSRVGGAGTSSRAARVAMNASATGGAPGASASTDVFISYSRKDKAFATRLYDAIVESGRTAWVDWEGIPPSAQWRTEIELAIVNGDAFVFVISPSSAASEVCAQEVAIAAEHNKKIIPMVWEDIEPSKLPQAIASRQWILSRALDNFESVVERLLGAMDTDIEWVRTHTRLLDRALRWRADMQRVSLLEGEELTEAEAWLAAAAAHEQKPSAEQAAFVAASRWRAQLELADGSYQQACSFSQQGRLQAASAHLLRAVELAPRGGAPPGYPATRDRADWAEEAWTTFQYMDRKRGRLRRRLSGHHGPISCLAVSADGRLALSGSFDGTARLWDLVAQTSPRVLAQHAGAVGAVGFSPAGEPITGGEDGQLFAWDTGSGNAKALLPASTEPITAIAFDARTRPAVGLRSGYVIIVGDGSPMFHERMHGGSITSIVFHDEGRRMSTASGRPSIGGGLAEGTINTWDFEKKKERHGLFGTIEGRVVAVAIAPDGTIALRSLEGGAIEVWDLANHQQIRRIDQPQTARCLAFSADGTFVASGADDSTIRLWSTKTWSARRVFDGHLAAVTVLLFTADGRTLLSGSIDATIAAWDLDEVPEGSSVGEDAQGYAAVAMASETSVAAAGRDDGIIHLLNSSTGEELTLGDQSQGVVSVALRADGKIALSGDDQGRVSVWDVEAGVRVHAFEGHAGLVWGVAFSPDGALAVSASTDRTVRLWDLASGDAVGTLAGHTADVISARFLPDGATVVTSSADASVRLWNVADGRQLRELRDGTAPCTRLDVSADGTLVLVGSNDGSIRLWDLAHGALVRRIAAHEQVVSCVAISPDGTRALTGSFDHTAKCWDLETGLQVTEQSRHSDQVSGVAFAPDGSAVTASMDCVVAFWDSETAEPSGALFGHGRGVTSVALSADGAVVLTGSLDRSVRVWDRA